MTMRHHRRDVLTGVAAGLLGGCVPGGGATGDVPDLVWGRRGIGDGRLLKPRAITIDREDRLYLADTTGRIARFDVDGNYQMHWSTPAAANGRPTGLGFVRRVEGDPTSDRIMVADTHYYRVLFYTTDGLWRPDETIGGTAGAGPGQFAFVTDVTSSTGGDCFAGEYNATDRIQRFDAGGRFIAAFGQTGQAPGQFVRPQSLMVRDNILYVADSCNHRIQRFDITDQTPTLIDVYGRPGTAAGEMFYPYGIDFLSDGNVVVVEYKNARVQLLHPTGRPIAIWGTHGTTPGRLNQPWGVVVDSSDRVHVLDSNNHRVQRFWF